MWRTLTSRKIIRVVWISVAAAAAFHFLAYYSFEINEYRTWIAWMDKPTRHTSAIILAVAVVCATADLLTTFPRLWRSQRPASRFRRAIRLFWIFVATLPAFHLALYDGFEIVHYDLLYTWTTGRLLNELSAIAIAIACLVALLDLSLCMRDRFLSRKFSAKYTDHIANAEDVDCPFCKEQIKRTAVICKHCKTDLSWRRHLQISQTSLALMTALVAVVGAVAPNIKRAVQSSHSQIRYTMTASTFDTVTLLITNYGPEIGLISDLNVAVTIEEIGASAKQGKKGLVHLTYEPTNQLPVVAKSQTTQQVVYKLTKDFQYDPKVFEKVTPQQAITFELSLSASECSAKLNVTDHGGEYRAKYYCQPHLLKLPLLKIWERL